ncbi:MAG: multidrug ABC transporter permease [Proteobacteria bacterium]|nr:MAG: multidrug ABC transporter permease [Pseudomonadota bacterium]
MSFLEACREEISLYRYDKYLLFSVSMAVLVIFILSANIFGDGVVRDLPIGVVDRDNSSVSRNLIRHINASATLRVKNIFPSTKEGVREMRNANIYALVVIPPNLEIDVKKGLSPTVSAFYNTQFVLVGRSISSNLMQVLTTFNGKISVLKTLYLGDKKISQAINESLPFNHQITPLFNLNFSYSKFLLVIIFPCIWQIFIVSTLILNFSAQRRKTSINLWLQRGAFGAFVAKLFIHQIFMFFWMLGFLAYFYGYLGWQMNGSFAYVVFAGYLTILASEAMACLIYFTSFDSARSLSMAAAYTAPSLAFAGITFPFSDMSPFAKFWNSLLPISHYINIQISQANYGLNISKTLPDILALLSLCLAFVVVLFVIRVLDLKKLGI